MNPVLRNLACRISFTNNLEQDVAQFLIVNGCPNTAYHSLRVASAARRLAERFGVDPDAAAAAGLLHDISAVFPNSDRVKVAQQLGVAVLPEENIFPQIIHQKISRVMAQEIFQIDNAHILSAVGCHTTLKPGASLFDMVLFVADKIEWDQSGTPPYLVHITRQLEISLQHAAFSYLQFLWQQRDRLKVLHPWAEAAYHEMAAKLNGTSFQDLV